MDGFYNFWVAVRFGNFCWEKRGRLHGLEIFVGDGVGLVILLGEKGAAGLEIFVGEGVGLVIFVDRS